MKKIILKNIGGPDKSSVYVNHKMYCIFLGNDLKEYFSSLRDAKKFMANTNRFLNSKLHELNHLYSEVFTQYRNAWFFFVSDTNNKYQFGRHERQIKIGFQDIEKRFERLIENSYSADSDPQIKELAAKQMAEVRPTVLYGDFLACDTFNEMERVAKIKVPTLLICGSADRMTPPNRSEYLHDQIENTRLHIVEGAGHMVMSEKPDEVVNLLNDFLDELQLTQP